MAVAQKIVSKAEGAIVDLREIQPSALARSWAAEWNKDARLIELILAQSRRIVKMDRGVIISETQHGFVCANAGVDQSNVPGDDFATVLPVRSRCFGAPASREPGMRRRDHHGHFRPALARRSGGCRHWRCGPRCR